MKNNVGQLTLRGLVAGILVCLAIGIGIFSRFSFVQKMPVQDAAPTRLADLERKVAETQAKLDQMEKALNQASKTTSGGAVNVCSKKCP